MDNPRRIGIFGGSFNPIHNGHLIVAQCFTQDLNLDVCFFVPNHISPFKSHNSELLSDSQRLELIKLSIQDNPKFSIDDYEITKQGISYTFETILYFKKKYPNDTLFLLIGQDQLIDFKKWKNWEIILNNSTLVVANRSIPFKESKTDKYLPTKYLERILFLNNPVIEISSTEIRKWIKEGKSIKYLVPKSVLSYIELNRLYY